MSLTRRIAPSVALGAALLMSGPSATFAQLGQGQQGADPRPIPMLQGPLAEPPEQARAWTSPATRLPRFVVSGAADLFAQGVADPRGCEYRSVEVVGGAMIRGTKGWVIPPGPGQPADATRFAVGWDGLVYPLVSIKEPADLAADAADMKPPFNEGRGFGRGFGWGGMGEGWSDPSKVATPLAACLLLRLDRADLAEGVWKAAGHDLPGADGPVVGGVPPGLKAYGASYLTLADAYARSLHEQAVAAHLRGDDALALAGLRRLAAFAPKAEAEAKRMGFAVPRNNPSSTSAEYPHLSGIAQLGELLADQERRAAEGPRPPVPPPGDGDRAARIAALVRDLDRSHVDPWAGPGPTSAGGASVVQQLVDEGEAAVEPLIRAFRDDHRLTRSRQAGSSFTPGRSVAGVEDAALAALTRILKNSNFDANAAAPLGPAGRVEVADRVQAYWDRYKAVPMVERWYDTLKDDRAGAEGWFQAVGNILGQGPRDASPQAAGVPRPGESLRQGHEPTVSALMRRRVGDLLKRQAQPVEQAGSMAEQLVAWDPAAGLPMLKEVSRVALERSARYRDSLGSSDEGLVKTIESFAFERRKLGDPDALLDYAAYIKASRPGDFHRDPGEFFRPIVSFPDDPSMVEAARYLFGDPKSAWYRIVDPAVLNSGIREVEMVASPLLTVPSFRAAVLRWLDDRAELGKATREASGRVQIKGNGWSTSASPSADDPLAPRVGEPLAFRACDQVAKALGKVDGAPRVELYWPEARRDAAVAEAAAFVRRFGERFVADRPYKRFEFDTHDHPFTQMSTVAFLKFPRLGRPATATDVEAGRAIFSLEADRKPGDGEVRVVEMAAHPVLARRRIPADGKAPRNPDNDRDGAAWQAEEVWRDGRWQRSYGLVAPHEVARVDAEGLDFGAAYQDIAPFGDGWDGAIMPVEGPGATYLYGPTPIRPAQPLGLVLKVRNRRGADRPIPSALVLSRPGQPAWFRPGLSWTLQYQPWVEAKPGDPQNSRVNPFARQAGSPEWLAPRDDAWSEVPGKPLAGEPPAGVDSLARRDCRPGEVVEAARFDLRDLFAFDRPGWYRATLTISPEVFGAGGSASTGTFAVDPSAKP